MSSLQKIDELFKQAQEAIINGDPEQARTVLWPEIKDAIVAYTDLSREKRRRLTSLIIECLEQPRFFQSGEKTQIRSIDELIARLQSPEEYPPLWHFW
jgi:hypothetical protein